MTNIALHVAQLVALTKMADAMLSEDHKVEKNWDYLVV